MAKCATCSPIHSQFCFQLWYICLFYSMLPNRMWSMQFYPSVCLIQEPCALKWQITPPITPFRNAEEWRTTGSCRWCIPPWSVSSTPAVSSTLPWPVASGRWTPTLAQHKLVEPLLPIRWKTLDDGFERELSDRRQDNLQRQHHLRIRGVYVGGEKLNLSIYYSPGQRFFLFGNTMGYPTLFYKGLGFWFES